MRLTILLFCLSLSSFLFAQNLVIQGVVQNADDKSTFPGATVMIANPADTSLVKGTVTDFDGNFRIGELKPGKYLVKIDFVGFQSFYKSVDLKGNVDLGACELIEDTKVLAAVEVVGKPIAAMQKGDTVQFSAKAYKTAPDASSQELIEKLPGITTVDGKLQANGENIQVILVDGKPFFGGDVNAALQNLPAEVIANIQIFDKKSDKAALSGFDDGNSQKTINIITKPSRKIGQFGKSTVGAGTNDTYQAATSVNMFNDDQRMTVTGLSNNTNLISYSADPNSMGDSRTQNGLIKTNSIGFNLGDNIGKNLEINAAYQYFWRETENYNDLLREYTQATDSGQVYAEHSYYDQVNQQHRLEMKLEYKWNDKNTLLMRPEATFRHEKTINDFDGTTDIGSENINSTDNFAKAKYRDYDYNSNLFYSRKFDKKGRSLTSRLHTGWHTNTDLSGRYATNIFADQEDSLLIIDQKTRRERTGLSWETQWSYTEPLSDKSMIELEYQVGDLLNDSDKYTWFAAEDGSYNQLDTTLSNTFENSYLKERFELGYQYHYEKWRFQMEALYQKAHMKNDQVFPVPFAQDRLFRSLLPSLNLDYAFNDKTRMRFGYNTWTDAPSVGNLQDVIDNSNPLQLKVGNPNLSQTYNHRARWRFWSNDMETGKSMFASVESTVTTDLITNSALIATEPTEVAEGVVLETGSQLIKPVNVDGFYSVRSYMSYGKPVDLIKSNVRMNGGVSFTRRPGLVNETINFSNTQNYRIGFSVSSNISENLDFNIATNSNYNVVENSLRPNLNNNYYIHTTNLRYRWVFWDGIVYRMDLQHQLNTGLSAGYDNTNLLVNMSAGKKFLKNNMAEISVNVYDLFQQNNNVGRNITELYVEDRQSTVLERYFMLTFTYNIRHFKSGTTMEDFEEI